VLGARFSENLNNPADPITIQEHALVGHEDPAHLGASFVLSQRLNINWEQVLQLSPEGIEDLVGRTDKDVIIPSKDTRTHIKAARVQDDTGNSRFVMRLGLPFGHSSAVNNDDMRAKGANLRDEKGIYFAGYCKEATIIERILSSQVGGTPGFMHDRLLSMMKGDVGGIFYIPSRADLDMDLESLAPLGTLDWRRFPGIDWSRVIRHFTATSANGYMHYSHQEYLFRMATMNAEDQAKYLPPSHRVLRILASVFARWQDNWYFDRKQQELDHLSVLRQGLGAMKADVKARQEAATGAGSGLRPAPSGSVDSGSPSPRARWRRSAPTSSSRSCSSSTSASCTPSRWTDRWASSDRWLRSAPARCCRRSRTAAWTRAWTSMPAAPGTT
jgi:hypothetical protein